MQQQHQQFFCIMDFIEAIDLPSIVPQTFLYVNGEILNVILFGVDEI